MNVLREINGYSLNEGNLMADDLYNVSIGSEVSLWFDNDTKEQLLNMSDNDYILECKELLKL